MNKKELEILLSRFKTFNKPKIYLEQYQTESKIAAEALWWAFMNGDIEGKTVADLGCGNGIFGLGAIALGAKKVIFLDTDERNLEIAKHNLELLGEFVSKKGLSEFIKKDVRDFNRKVDVVIQNPPFGVKVVHNDKIFLSRAFEVAKKIYSFHKVESENFINSFSKDNGFIIAGKINFKFPLKKTLVFHVKRVHYVDVACWLLKKAN